MNDKRCTICGLTEAGKQLAIKTYKDYMDVPDKYKDTTYDFRHYTVTACSKCTAPLRLDNSIDLLEKHKFFSAVKQLYIDESGSNGIDM